MSQEPYCFAQPGDSTDKIVVIPANAGIQWLDSNDAGS